MRKAQTILLTAIMLASVSFSHSQNLVMNPSFESVNTGSLLCSWYVSSGEFNAAVNNWTMPTGGSTDLFHSSLATSCFCSPWSTNASAVGQQTPRTGSAMSAIFVYGAGGCTPYREYLQGRLSSPLVPGQQYTVEFYVSMADYSMYACNNIGVYFTTASFYSSSMCVYSVTPQVNYTGIITDKTNWTLISMTFTATAAFQYFTIGNFYYDTGTTTTNVGGSKAQTRYFVDDVSIMVSNVNPVITVNNPTICAGQSATLTATSSIAGTTFAWSNGATGATISVNPTSTTTYTVTGTAPSGTTGTATATVTVNPLPVVTASSNSPVCETQSLNFTGGGGAAGATYTWTGPDGWTSNLQNPVRTPASVSMSGTYTLVVTNTTGCSSSNTTTVVVQARPNASINSVGPFCQSDSPVTLTAATGGGTWSGTGITGSTAGTFSPAVAGSGDHTITYSVTTGACTGTSSITIHVDGDVNADISPAGPFCINASAVNLTAVSNVGTWSGNGITNAATGQFSPSVAGAGTHVITYSIVNGACSDTQQESIVVNALPTVSIGGLSSGYCIDAPAISLILSPAGGIVSGPGVSGTNFSPSVAGVGNHIVTYVYTDGNGCSNTATQNVQVFSLPTVQIAGLNAQYCDNAGIAIITGTPSGGVFSGPGITGSTFDPATAGLGLRNITYAYSDAYGCSNQITVQTLVTSVPQVNVQDYGNPSCNGFSNGFISISVSGGTLPYSYDWSDPITVNSATIQSIPAGNYSVTVYDNYGCSNVGNAVLTQPESLIVSAVVNNNVSCYGMSDGSAVASASGGTGNLSYLWSDPEATASALNNSLAAGVVTVIVTDEAGCTASSTITITQPSQLVATATSSPLVCGVSQGSISVSVSGGTAQYGYLWSNGSNLPVQNPVAPGNYRVTVTDANGCTASSITVVDMQGSSPVVITQPVALSCYGDSDAVLTGSMMSGMAPFTYSWSNGSTVSSIANIAAGVYSVTVTDAWGCSGSQAYTVTQPDALSIVVSGVNISCYGYANGSLSTLITGGTPPFTFSWSNGASQSYQNNIAAGNYIVTVTDVLGCSITGSRVIGQPLSPVTVAISTTDVTCNGERNGAINLIATGGTLPYAYHWQYNGFESAQQQLTSLQAGIYSFTVTDANHCELDSMATISEPSEMVVTYISTNPSCIGADDGYIEIVASGGTFPYMYNWYQGSSDLPYIMGLIQGNYLITVVDANNCIRIIEQIVLTDDPIDCIRIPNAFTPNNDGVNDTWIIENIDMFPAAVVQVFNRWGQKLFEAKGVDEPWNGYYDGKLLPTGSYLYAVRLFNGEEPYVGIVTLVK